MDADRTPLHKLQKDSPLGSGNLNQAAGLPPRRTRGQCDAEYSARSGADSQRLESFVLRLVAVPTAGSLRRYFQRRFCKVPGIESDESGTPVRDGHQRDEGVALVRIT